ncbi:hypothetical protein GUA87_07650 [Sneathiella sp. P13V-1]|uniref:RHS repeat-associated core domain-containing protein n=1 Tax=Sneathiella sp. P13V-1 TaxID=2697366 RepID=UPI00187B67F9|nr:RHS repeat-associated core domain-containing protein [Sneathiella sp. P13V-1]MBE7636717.1 hypothetical protein [Sneathiella sp. P13V-1]
MLKFRVLSKNFVTFGLAVFFGMSSTVAKEAFQNKQSPDRTILQNMQEKRVWNDPAEAHENPLSDKAGNQPKAIPYEKPTRFISPDLKSGDVHFRHPVAASPGVNGLTPDIEIAFNNIDPKMSALIVQLGEIAVCLDEPEYYCLSDKKLIQKDLKKETQSYHHPLWPGVNIARKDNAWVLENRDGLKRVYLSNDGQKSFQLNYVEDEFGNFIDYRYDQNSKNLLTVSYGPQSVTSKGVRRIDFRYHEGELTQVLSSIGRDVFHSIEVSHSQDVAARVRECSRVIQRIYCRPEINFKWTQGSSPRLEAVSYGRDLVAKVHYEEMEEQHILKQVDFLLKGKRVRADQYEFLDPIKDGGKQKHYGRVYWYKSDQQNGRFLQYGRGVEADLVILSGQFKAPQGGAVQLSEQPKLAETRNSYGLHELEHGTFLLKNSVETVNLVDRKKTLSQFRYDNSGRLVEEKTGDIVRTSKYWVPNVDENPHHLNRLQSITVENEAEKTKVSRSFNYKFEDGKLRSVDERVIDSSNSNNHVFLKYVFDEHGNVIEHLGKGGVATKISYEKIYASFPEKLAIEGPGRNEVAVLTFDPRFGIQTSSIYDDGSFERVEVGPFGLIQARSEKYTDPVDKSATSVAYTATEFIEYTATESGGLRKSFHKAQKAPDQQQVTISKINQTTDAFGRLESMSSAKHDTTGRVIEEVRIEQSFVEGNRHLKLIRDNQLFQEVHFDQFGQVTFEKSGEYGESRFTYDENGQVIAVEKGGESLTLRYDQFGRLIEKILPAGQRYNILYDAVHKNKPATVHLPSGKKISYFYNAKGLTTQKTVHIPNARSKKGFLKFDISYSYVGDRLSEVLYPNGSRIGYTYDNSRLKDIHWIEVANKKWMEQGTIISRYEPDITKGQKSLKKYLANGMVETYRWAANGSIEGINFKNEASDLSDEFSVSYLHNSSNNLQSEILERKAVNTSTSALLAYEYDALDHLKSVLLSSEKSSASDMKLAFDSLENRLRGAKRDRFGNLISNNRADRTIAAHTFDMENKLTSSVIQKGNKQSLVEYDYDHFGKRLSKSVKGVGAKYYIDPFYELQIDEDGALQESLYVWDHMGKVAVFKRQLDEEHLSALYAGISLADLELGDQFLSEANKKIDQATDNALTFLKVEKETLILLSVAAIVLILILRLNTKTGCGFFRSTTINTVLISYLSLCMSPTAYALQAISDQEITDEEIVFFHHDVRGSLVARSGGDGVAHFLPRPTPFGAMPDAGADQKYRFAGLEYDTETGLYYAGARYYDPVLGVFLSPDPIRASNNPYEYANDNPVNLVDISGMMPHEPIPLTAPDADHPEADPTLEVAVSAGSPSAPASAIEMSAAAEDAPQVSDEEEEDVIDEPDRWVRYPTFSRLTFGYQEGVEIPEYDDREPEYEEADEEEYNRHIRGEYMQGWTRFGGFVQALGSAFLLALFASTSFEYEDGDIAEAGFGRDLLANFLTLLVFIGFSYGYSGNEADYWAGVQKHKAKERDYWIVSARRVVWKVSFQLVTFPLLMVARNSIRGYPAFADEDPSATDKLNYLFYNMLRFTPYSMIGNMALLPFFAIFKEPYPGYDDAMTEEKLSNRPWLRRQLIRAGLAYRGFSGRKGFWDQEFEEGSWSRRVQYAWYPLYMLQLYMWFAVGSCGYYGGMATMIGKVPGFDQAAFYKIWRSNAILLSLCPPASPVTIINFWHRKSFTIIKKRSWKHPRTEGFLFRVLGPIEGLRVAKFDDSSYLSVHDWLPKLQVIRDAERDADDAGSAAEHHDHFMNDHDAVEVAP